MLDAKGIGFFLAMILILTLVVLVGAQVLGWNSPETDQGVVLLVLLVLLWTPALSGWVARRVVGIPASTQPESTLWPLPTAGALAAAVLVPLVFALIYLMLSLLGIATADWSVTELMAVAPDAGTPEAAGVPPALLLVLAFAVMLTAGPTLFAAAVVGHEYGWRGFLLPRLMPMGRLKAYVLVSVAWSAWLTLVLARLGMLAPATDAAARFFILVFAFSFVASEIWRRTRNHGLCAVAFGAFAANMFGVWAYLFPNDHAPWGGTSGVVAIVVWGALALMVAAKGNRGAER